MGLIHEGAHGPSVTQLQNQLVAHGAKLTVDGIFGEQTDRALRAYQQAQGLVADGILGPKTAAALSGQPLPRTLSQADLANAADQLDVDLAAVMAVNEVESSGHGFIGRLPVILFERHIMYRQLKQRKLGAAALARQYPRLVNTQPGGYIGGTAEHQRLNAARRIDDTSALSSASWGLFQIMGFHAKRLGYKSVQAFAQQMRESEAEQLGAFVAFIQADESLHQALADHQWADFAHGYNGPAYARNDYDHKLAAAWRRHDAHHQKAAA